LGRISASNLLAITALLVSAQSSKHIKGDDYKPLVGVQEGGKGPSIDVLEQVVDESRSTRPGPGHFASLYKASVYKLVQVLPESVGG